MAMDQIAPEDQDKLAQLFGGKLGGNAADLFAAAAAKGGGNGAGAPTPMLSPSPMGLPGMPGATVAPRPVAASDDPALQPKTSPMPGTPATPALPSVPTFQNPPIDRMQDLSSKIAAASQPIRRQDYAPHWWERILAPVIGAVGGFSGDVNTGVNAGRMVLDRRYNRAIENQQKTVSPLEAEFKRQSEIEPFQRSANENAQRTFSDTMDVAKERREQGTADTNAQYKSDIADIRQQIADNNLEMAQKRLDETSEKNRNNLDVQQQLLAIRQQLADARDRQVDKQKGDKEASRAQFKEIEERHQNALSKAEDEYSKEIDDLDQMKRAKSKGGKQPPDDSADRAAALQRLNGKKDRAESAYRAEIVAAGGSVNGQGGKTPATTPAATTAPAGTAKTVTKDVVQKYADAHKVGNRTMTYAEALQGFQSKGYKVQ